MIFYRRLGDIKALSFDLDDTLYNNVPAIAKAESDFCLYLKQRYFLPDFSASPAFWNEGKTELLKDDPDLDSDVTLFRAYGLMHCFKKLGYSLDYDEALSLVEHFVKMRSENIKLDDRVLKLLFKLKEHYTLAAVSNGNVDKGIVGLDGIFDYDLRPRHGRFRRKPYCDLFYELLKITGLRACEVLHVGDDPVTDVLGSVYASFNSACIYKGYAGKSSGFKYYKVLPHVVLCDVFELEDLLL